MIPLPNILAIADAVLIAVILIGILFLLPKQNYWSLGEYFFSESKKPYLDTREKSKKQAVSKVVLSAVLLLIIVLIIQMKL